MIFLPKNEPPRMAANVIKRQTGSTWMADSLVQDNKSSFELFISHYVQHIILNCTNLEVRHVFGEKWKEMDQTNLQV